LIQYIRKHFSDGLVIFLAITWLALVFIPMLATTNRAVMLVESNVVILALEIVICIFAIVWAVARFRRGEG
jgi:hypothetical protein